MIEQFKKAAEQRQKAREAARLASEKQKYIGLIRQSIQANWIDQENLSEQLSVKVAIEVSSRGQVTNTRVIASSGNKAYDRQALLAIQKASPLPLPDNDKLAGEFRHITLILGGKQ